MQKIYNKNPALYNIIIAYVAGMLGAQFLPFDKVSNGATVGVFLVALFAFIHPGAWKTLVKTGTTKGMAMILLAINVVLLIIGTVVIQNGKLEQYMELYGYYVSEVIFFFGFHDIFHSPIFTISMAMLAVGLFMLLVQRAPSQMKQRTGLILAHFAILLIVAGGLVSRNLGEKGVIPLAEGQTSDLYESVNQTRGCHFACHSDDIEAHSPDKRRGIVKDLPFAITLNDFHVAYFDRVKRLYLYEYNHQQGMFEAVTSWPMEKAQASINVVGKKVAVRDAPEKGEEMMYVTVDGEDIMVDTSEPVPVQLTDELVVVVEPTPEKVKDYLSMVTISKDGKEIGEYPVRVNHPIDIDGYKIYQAAYDPTKPDYSMFQVVYDPGLWIVYAGFLVLFIGTIFMVYVTPMISKEEAC